MSYATLLANGWDTVEETFLWRVDPRVADNLDVHKEKAQEADPRGGAVVAFGFGGESYAMRPSVTVGGWRWMFGNDDLLWMIQAHEGGVAKVRYLAAGLWEHGLDALRERAETALLKSGRPSRENWKRIVRADYAWDFYSPSFTAEMQPGIGAGVVCHSSVKRIEEGAGYQEFGPAGRIETLTVGRKTKQPRLQVQVYDKGREITQASGKTWMIALWEREGYYPPDEGRPRDVWRLEARMFKLFFRDRNIETVDQLRAELPALLSETIYNRRLTVPQPGDVNRRRWPLHPLWQLAQDHAGGTDMLPLGRQLTGARSAVVAQLEKQAAGTLRASVVAGRDGFTVDDLGPLFERVKAHLDEDPQGPAKVARLRDRYELLDEAK